MSTAPTSTAPPRPSRWRSAAGRFGGRAGLGLADQALSALTNVALSVLVANAVGASGFGAFAVAFLLFGVALSVERSVVGQPLSIRFAVQAGTPAWRGTAGSAMGVALGLGLVSGALLLVAGLVALGVSDSGVGPALVALAVVLPGLVVQDACRMAFFAQSRPGLALANDGAWAVLQLGGMALLVGAGTSSAWPFVLVWGGAATAAAAWGFVQLGVLPHLRSAWGWARDQRDLTGYLLLENLVGSGASQGSILAVGAIGSVADVGSLRAAQTLLGPLGIVAGATMSLLLPEVSRRGRLALRPRLAIAGGVSAAVALVSAVYSAVLLVLPDEVGRALFDDTWDGAAAVLLPLCAFSVASAAALGPAVVVYASGQARRTLGLHLVEAPLLVAGLVGGAALAGVRGAAWGMAAATAVMVPLWYSQLLAIARADAAAPDEPADQADPAAPADPGDGAAVTGARGPGGVSA